MAVAVEAGATLGEVEADLDQLKSNREPLAVVPCPEVVPLVELKSILDLTGGPMTELKAVVVGEAAVAPPLEDEEEVERTP